MPQKQSDGLFYKVVWSPDDTLLARDVKKSTENFIKGIIDVLPLANKKLIESCRSLSTLAQIAPIIFYYQKWLTWRNEEFNRALYQGKTVSEYASGYLAWIRSKFPWEEYPDLLKAAQELPDDIQHLLYLPVRQRIPVLGNQQQQQPTPAAVLAQQVQVIAAAPAPAPVQQSFWQRAWQRARDVWATRKKYIIGAGVAGLGLGAAAAYRYYTKSKKGVGHTYNWLIPTVPVASFLPSYQVS